MADHYVIGWRGQLVNDVQETAGWAWLRMNELLWRRHARRILRWMIRHTPDPKETQK